MDFSRIALLAGTLMGVVLASPAMTVDRAIAPSPDGDSTLVPLFLPGLAQPGTPVQGTWSEAPLASPAVFSLYV